MRNEPLCEVGVTRLDGIKEKIKTVRWPLHQINRLSQGKGRGSRVKMVYKENERKTEKKKRENKKQWGNGAMAAEEREEKRMHKD